MSIPIIAALKAEASFAHLDPQLLNICGIGAANASACTKKLITEGAKQLLNIGFCAGLAPNMPAGTLLLPQKILNEHQESITITNYELPKAIKGTIISCDNIISDAKTKQEYYNKYHALAADMESFTIAKLAEAANIKFFCLKVILDPMDYSLPYAIKSWQDNSILQRVFSILTIGHELISWGKLLKYYFNAKSTLKGATQLFSYKT